MKKLLLAVMSAILALAAPGAAWARQGTVADLAQVPASAQVVTVGFYPVNIYGVDPSTGTFTYDGYVWLRWKGDIDPTETMEFVNAVDKSSVSKEYLYDAPQVFADGSRYQIMRIESQFFKSFSLADFPLDRHKLTITIEDSLHGVDELVYEIDRLDTTYSSSLSVSGWNMTGWGSARTINEYGSNFGDTSVAQESQFAQMNYFLGISRPESYFVWKLLLPLVVVLSGAWIALLLNPVLTETRAALPASALLTTVFLQQSYTESLPETGGLVLLDKIYVVAYVLIVVTLGRVIIKSRNVDDMSDAEVRKLRGHDALVLAVQVAVFTIATTAIVLLR